MINGPAGYDPIQGGMRTEMKAGPGIDISNGTISTTGEAGVPYVGGTGIDIHGATVEADLTAGYRTEINGSTIGQLRYMPIETVTGSSITMQAGHAYKIYATSAAVTLNTETIPANSFGLEGHLEIYVAGTGYVITGTNVVLANALEPDSVNNLTARFHDGLCILSVEDHVAGYIVTVNAASGAGSLAYGLSTSTNEYIAFDASLNGTTIDLSGSTANGEKHVVGNSYADTILTGSVDCGTSKFTVANLSLQDVVVGGGTMTLGDAYIPSGSTVAVSGGGLAIEKVTGDGGTIDLGKTEVIVSSASHAYAHGVVLTGGSSYDGSVFINGTADFVSCVISGNSGTAGYVTVNGQGSCFCSSCQIESGTWNPGTGYRGIRLLAGATIRLKDTSFSDGMTLFVSTCHAIFDGKVDIPTNAVTGAGSVTISSGAVVDLTGNTNATPINPSGGITLYGGVTDDRTTIYGSAGSATQSRGFSAECVITGSAVTKIGAISGATVSLASSSCQLEFIKSGEETVSITYMQANESPYVLETQQGAGAVLVRVSED